MSLISKYRANYDAKFDAKIQKKRNKRLIYGHASYLGGHPTLGRLHNGNLVLTREKMGIGSTKPRYAILQWTDIESIEITSDQVSKSKVGAVLVFGIFGLAAKGTRNQTSLIVHTKDNQVAYYQAGVNTIAFRAGTTALLDAVGVPLYDAVTQQNNSTPKTHDIDDITEQLTKLAKLKEQGIITQEDFDKKKAQLLDLP